jgi:hypothetical protein
MLDPALFALGGTLLGAGGLKTLTFFLEKKPDKVTVEVVASREVEATTMCSVYEIRHTQQKMVDAGIIKQWELSICDNENCDNCYLTGLAGKRVPKYQEPRELVVAKEFTQRTRTVRNETINVPEGVPDHAYAQIQPYNEDFFYILWSWQDQTDGKKYGMKSMHPKQGSFRAGYRTGAQAIKKLQQDKKYLKNMLDEAKRQQKEWAETQKMLSEAGRKMRTTTSDCRDCETFELRTADGKVHSYKMKPCAYHKDKALKEALAKSPVRRRSTGDLGPL